MIQNDFANLRSVTKAIIIFTYIALMTAGYTKQTSLQNNFTYSHGGIIRADSTKKEIALIFTGGDFAVGGKHIADVLKIHDIQAGFFFTGDFYRDPDKAGLIRRLIADGHYLGPHSDQHLLYCSWENRDSLLVTKQEFIGDMLANYAIMDTLGIKTYKNQFFIPPYEWYNDTISAWAQEQGWILLNYTPGTLSNADYTIPSMKNYRSSDMIWVSILDYEQNAIQGLNGFLLLLHVGTHPERIDKFYHRLEPLIEYLHGSDYQFRRLDQILDYDQ